MLENLINVDRFNITFARYLLLYAVYGYFLRLSLWVDVIFFAHVLVCAIWRKGLLESLEKPAPTSLKRKIRLESLKICS